MLMSMMIAMLLFSSVLMAVNYVLCSASLFSREKLSSFECGFDPNSAARLPFSMHFFLVALIFLIFDVEISLLAPISIFWGALMSSHLVWLSISVIMVLLLGALLEWAEGSLDWGK